MPVVSIIIPTYNREDVIERALDSCKKQSFDDFEVIVVDDGSTDETENIIKNYECHNINYIKQKNQGANAARNNGIKQASGKYISFLDSDDELLPQHLEKAVVTLSETDTEVLGVYTSFKSIRPSGTNRISHAEKGKIDITDITRKNIIGGFSCTTFKKEAFDRVGKLDEDLPASQDYDFYVRLLKKNHMIGIPEILTIKHQDVEAISSAKNIDKRIEGQNKIMKKHENVLSNSYIAEQHYNRGFLYADLNKMNKSRAEFKTAIKLKPTELLYYYHYFSSLFGKQVFDKFIDWKLMVKSRLM